MTPIPYGRQSIDEDDIQAVVAVLRSPHLTQGPVVDAFESALARRVGARFCTVFSSATSALQCAVRALRLPAGSSGVTSANTFVASANCMALSGLVPRFADIDPATLNVHAASLEEASVPDTTLLVPVHFAGQPCDMASIGAFARSRGMAVVEDASHAIGSTHPDGDPVGSCKHSDMTVFSFHPVKTLTSGEGGAVTTNDPDLHASLVRLRSHGITRDPSLLESNPGPWWYEQHDLSGNHRITDIQCALGLSQLGKLDLFKTARRSIVERYRAAMAHLPHVVLQSEPAGMDSCYHLFATRIDFEGLGTTRTEAMARLASRGVGTQVHYIPVHLQPWYRRAFGYGPGMLPHAEAYYERALSLPLHPSMTGPDVDLVIASVADLR